MDTAEHADADADADSWLGLAVRFAGGLVVLFVAVLSIGHFFADEARGLAQRFVSELGVWGFALGTLLADGLHFPIPPQFYMFVGISTGMSPALALPSIGAGSVLGGALAFGLARAASSFRWAERIVDWLFSSSRLQVREDHPYRFVIVSSLTPVPFAWVCYAIGFAGFSKRAFVLLAALRLPKLLVYYAIVRAGWTSMG